MNQRHLFFVALVALAACSPRPPPRGDASAPLPARSPSDPDCTANQFVACESGEACARRHGKHVHPLACHDRAASACDALRCKHGCNIHHGEPKEVHCAPNAASSSHMKKCAGFSNWACPENMKCELSDAARRADDAMGECVPSS